MGRRYFTEEDQKKLRENPYTARVSNAQISFTDEFKEAFWRKRCEGRTIRGALESCGYDFEMLGHKRVYSIALKIQKMAESGADIRNSGTQGGSGTTEGKNQEARIRDLEARVEYLNHQMDWIKKVMSVRGTAKRELS